MELTTDLMGDKRILIGGIFHETNTFAAGLTHESDFESRWVYSGQAVIDRLATADSEINGIVSVAKETDSVELVPTLVARAVPGPVVVQDVYDSYRDRILGEVDAGLDGVVLVLHGSMVTKDHDDAEGELLSAVRDRVGPETPVVATLDLHANVSAAMTQTADALVSYETYPHVDKVGTGQRAMELLLDVLERGLDTEMYVERPPMITYPPRQDTRSEPMASIQERARKIEDRDDVLKVNVNAGFMQSDVPFMGPSIVTVATGRDGAADETAALGRHVWERRDELVADYPTAREGVELAREQLDGGAGTIVLADTGDNPGSGGATDGTVVLRELLEQFGDTDYEVGLAVIRDPEVVATGIESGVGTDITVDVGGKTDDLHGDPIAGVTGYVKAITDGVYVNRGPMETGQTKQLGRTILLECGPERSVNVIVVENRVQPYDREVWRHVGVYPDDLAVIAIKSKNHFRADYEVFADEIIVLDTPGAGAISPERFEFERIDRPKYPIDDVSDDFYRPTEGK